MLPFLCAQPSVSVASRTRPESTATVSNTSRKNLLFSALDSERMKQQGGGWGCHEELKLEAKTVLRFYEYRQNKQIEHVRHAHHLRSQANLPLGSVRRHDEIRQERTDLEQK